MALQATADLVSLAAKGSRFELFLTTLLLAIALLLAALAIKLADRWRKAQADDPLTASEQLAHFRQLYDQGALSTEEYERLRLLLGERMRQETEAPGTPAIPPPQKPEAPETGIRPPAAE